MKKVIALLFSLFVSILIFFPVLCSAEVGDYDGDGLSDMSFAFVDRDTSSTAWLSLNANTGAYAGFSVLPVAADALVAGSWWPNDEKTYPGAVYVRPGQLLLEWHLQTPWDSSIQVGYGFAGDSIPNQGDLDCDGITDLVVVRQNAPGALGFFKTWYVRSSANGYQTYAELFGIEGDRPTIADIDGDGCSEMVILRPGSYYWFTKKFGSAEYSFTQWGLNGDYPLTPTDLDNDGLSEYIIARDTPTGQLAFARSQNGATQTIALGVNGSIPLTGNFKGSNTFAWQDRANGQFNVRNIDGTIDTRPIGIRQNALIAPSGRVIQPTETGQYPAVAPRGSTPGCIHTGGPTDFIDGTNGALWKPVSEGVGNRAPAILLDNMSYCGARLTILDRNGNQTSGIQKNHCICINGCRPHWWSSKTASELARSAPITVKIEIDGRTECRVVKDPQRRND